MQYALPDLLDITVDTGRLQRRRDRLLAALRAAGYEVHTPEATFYLLAQRFNTRFGETFRVPEGIFPEIGARILDLQDPARKMSTTGGTELGTVGMLDPLDVLVRKFEAAVTDSGRGVRYDPKRKPGVSNLIEVLSVATGEPVDAIEGRFDGRGYAAFKQEVADAVVALLGPIRLRYEELRADEGELRHLLASVADAARAASAPTLERMYERMGFVRP